MPERSSNEPEQDPVVSRSLSLPLLIFSLLLVVVLFWSLYDETYGQRPWKGLQERFVKQYATFVKQQLPKQAAQEKQIRESAEYQKLDQDLKAAEEAVRPQIAEI